jgi:hypothetical protein
MIEFFFSRKFRPESYYPVMISQNHQKTPFFEQKEGKNAILIVTLVMNKLIPPLMGEVKF